MLSCLRYIASIFIVLVFLFPIFWFGLTAIKPRSAIFNKDAVVWFDFSPTLESFTTIWYGSSFYSIKDSMFSSVVIAVGSTLLVLVFAVPGAYCLSRMRFRGDHVLWLVILIQRFLPPIAAIIPLVIIFQNLGLRNTHSGVILAHGLLNLPVALFLMKSFFDDIPKSVDEMALIDGATRFQSFLFIILPTVRNGLVATAILCFIFSWTEFLLSLFLTSSIRTLPVKISLFDAGSQVNYIAATGTLAMIPGIVFILFVQRYLVRGLTMGAMKD